MGRIKHNREPCACPSAHGSRFETTVILLAVLAVGRLGPAHDQLATEEFLVVELFDGALGFLDRLHLHKSEAFRALVVPIAHDLGVLHVADAVEELEQVALGGVEGQITDVKPR